MTISKQFSNQTLIAGGKSRNREFGGWTCIERGFGNCDSYLHFQNIAIHSFTFSMTITNAFYAGHKNKLHPQVKHTG